MNRFMYSATLWIGFGNLGCGNTWMGLSLLAMSACYLCALLKWNPLPKCLKWLSENT
jgi:hypothetical protein